LYIVETPFVVSIKSQLNRGERRQIGVAGRAA
jgi:hypothetical protein